MAPMNRLAAALIRSPATAAASSTISRRAAVLPAGLRPYATGNGKGTDTTNASGQPRDKAQVKNHDEAQKANNESAPLSEGHTNDRAKSNTRFQDQQTQEATKAKEERDHGYSHSNIDAINTSQRSTGQAEKQRKANSTDSEEGRKFNPGQGGDQVGGGASNEIPLKKGEGIGSKEEAPSSSTLGGMGQLAKNIIGQGPASGKSFHTYAGPLRAKATSTPEEAVDKGARKPKDTGVGAEQNAHLPHHRAGEGDQMPAVKNNAGLPSKGGKTPSDKKPSGKRHKSTNAGQGPAGEARPTGTATSPGSRAVDPKTGTHSPSWAPESGPQATYEHVINSPEPDSHKSNYVYAESMPDGAVPSGQAPRSSTSDDAYNSITTSGILKQEAGIGSSNKTHMNNQNEAGEIAAEMVGKYPGQEGDDAGGRSKPPPPDVANEIGIEIEDTLPKPIKK